MKEREEMLNNGEWGSEGLHEENVVKVNKQENNRGKYRKVGKVINERKS